MSGITFTKIFESNIDLEKFNDNLNENKLKFKYELLGPDDNPDDKLFYQFKVSSPEYKIMGHNEDKTIFMLKNDDGKKVYITVQNNWK